MSKQLVNATKRTGRRIGINAHLLGSGEGYRRAGVSRYIAELLGHLEEADPEGDYVLFLPAGSSLRLTHQTRVSTRRTEGPARRVLWEQLELPRAAQREHLALLHSPVNVQPLLLPCQGVVTVMDLSFLVYPRSFRPQQRLYQTVFTRVSAQRAAQVIAISLQTAQDLVRRCGTNASKIAVIYPGVDSSFRPAEPAAIQAFRQRRGLPERFILHVGTLEPRKNLPVLLRAFDRARSSLPAGCKLVLAGGKGWLYEPILRTIEELQLESEVILRGFVPDEELPLWYNCADVFVYPSLYEGFGLPVLEAMACGCPVMAARSSSLPEVVGDAGLLLTQHQPEVWAEELVRVCSNATMRAELRELGLERARQFSWTKMARETVRVYREVLSGGT
ncbi:MAG TPA: glycosyltransferase family 1 protein [Anaerolineae bacterium]|nr:glycosyltransferase family 1 protein [Anaerolineae bacterium]HQJ51023.1 glycosyltransferase family 1 protein [Anaerolineae bacterium]